MRGLVLKTVFATFLLSVFPFGCLLAKDEDVAAFIRAGIACYSQGKLSEASLEFENVLLIDKSNFLAKVWLAQVYIDKKDLVNAKRLLMEASVQAPNHPKVQALQKLLGMSKEHERPKLVDPVVAEAISGIASATKSRAYGIVIPEDKVIEENFEKRLISFDNEVFDEKNEVLETIAKNREALRLSQEKLEKHIIDRSNPLSPVFEIYHSQGLNSALDKYFEMVLKDPRLTSKDDRGLIDEGNKIFATRFLENAEDEEARYYYGAMQYVNGLYKDSEEILAPFRARPGAYGARLRQILANLDKWREEENQRIAQAKLEEEQRLAREAAEKAEAEAKKNDVWEKIKNQGKDNNAKNSDLANTREKGEAATLHSEAYKLYKKGKLDESISKYNEAISKDPENPEYSYHLGLAWTDKGLSGDSVAFDRAISAFQRVISLSPNAKLAKDAESMIKDIQQAKYNLGEN